MDNTQDRNSWTRHKTEVVGQDTIGGQWDKAQDRESWTRHKTWRFGQDTRKAELDKTRQGYLDKIHRWSAPCSGSSSIASWGDSANNCKIQPDKIQDKDSKTRHKTGELGKIPADKK